MMKQMDGHMSIAKKIAFIVAGIVVVLIAAVAFLLFWHGNTKEILSVADKFRPSSSWKLESELVRPPAFTCLNGGTCPEVSRSWEIKDSLTKQQFTSLIRSSGWMFSIEGDCTLPKNSFGEDVSICSAEGVDNNYNVAIWLDENSSPPNQQKIVLSVRPE